MVVFQEKANQMERKKMKFFATEISKNYSNSREYLDRYFLFSNRIAIRIGIACFRISWIWNLRHREVLLIVRKLTACYLYSECFSN